MLSTRRTIFPFGPVERRFTQPVYQVRMAIGLGSNDSVQPNLLEIFDSSSNLINSVIASDAFVSLTSPVPIDHFRVTATSSDRQAAIDDVEFTAVPEPLPTTMVLLGVMFPAMMRWPRMPAVAP